MVGAAIALTALGQAAELRAADAAKSSNESAPLEEVVVTGTHIARYGYDAPTPVTSVQVEQLADAAPTTIADGLNQLPQFSAPTNRTYCCAAGLSGNYLNLRGLGPNGYLRTLVLVDGFRVAPTSNTGAVDANLLPGLLVSHIDVVTGGASAVYGSDAVSGVVNYIIDNEFTGVKGFAQGGISNYHDDESLKGGVAYGTGFADDRGHVIASFEHFDTNGIPDLQSRPTSKRNWLLVGNGSADNPYHLVLLLESTTAGALFEAGGLLSVARVEVHAMTASPRAGQRRRVRRWNSEDTLRSVAARAKPE